MIGSGSSSLHAVTPEAWCSHDVGRVVDHFVPGTVAFNGGEPIGIEEVAKYDRQLHCIGTGS